MPNFAVQAREVVFSYLEETFDKSDAPINFTMDDVYVVWFSKTLQNWKALVSTTLPDQMYYEVTCNGDKGEIYLDVYKKFKNIVFEDPYEPVPFKG